MATIARFSRKVFSGIQPTGVPHLGNYFGAITQWTALQEEVETKCLYSVVDLHSVTVPHYDPKALQEKIEVTTASLLACGVRSDTLFLQSMVPEHGQLCWLFNCISTMNKMYHFPQFKEKSQGMRETPLGLYLYPILQSADVLLYKGTHVPVGQDQLPHIHLINDIAHTFNKRFGKNIFPKCKPILDTKSSRLRDLRYPDKKMSKSADPKGKIDLNESPDNIRSKIKKSMTDCQSEITFEPETRPGVSNLVLIHSLCSGKSTAEIVASAKGIDTGQYKEAVAIAVIERLTPIRARMNELLQNRSYLWQLLKTNSEALRPEAQSTLEEARIAMGMMRSTS
ncbi:tryptophan--tRNA ligase, mitochondrial-like [Varroa destructor]|uniref:tryptophan--tRNA ligase n=1 Tax=Varroa destructor TaxID=109461 RepID=A0A7M7KBG1_VARDE|nr:tryptophan--tRNA ligase, mitochondrial-like [Varroa destructor]